MRGLLAAFCVLAAAGAAFAAGLPGTRTAADRKAWRAILHWPAACEASWRRSNGPGAGVGTWSLGKSARLVEVSCYLGAYQGTSMLYLANTKRRKSGPLPLLIYEDPGTGRPRAAMRTTILGALAFTPRTGRLTVLDKFRGVGDCGIYSTFALVGEKFRPTEVRAKLACDGKPPFDPARWPKLPLPKG